MLDGIEKPIPHLAIYEVSAKFSFPKDFNVNNFHGLLFCHIVKTGLTLALHSYWVDRESASLANHRFEPTLGLASPIVVGAAIDVERPQRPWWKPKEQFSAREWILAAFALVGAFLGLRDYAAIIFAAPYAALSFPFDEGHTNAVAGERITIPLTTTSEVRFAPMMVTFYSASIQMNSDDVPFALNLDTSILPNLAPGQSQLISISGSAPQRNARSSSLEKYTLRVTGDLKAGILRCKRPLPVPARELWVWPAAPLAPQLKLEQAAANYCALSGDIYASKLYPQGLVTEFTLIAKRNLVTGFYVDHFTTTRPMIRKLTKTDSALDIQFRTPPLNKFQQLHYAPVISLAVKATESDCKSLVSKLAVSLQAP